MSDPWEQCSGQLIDGKFLLLRYLGGSEHSGVFLTERQERGKIQQAAIKLTPTSPDGGERQLARWRRAAKLSHRHLIQLFEMGRCQLGGTALLYLVMEYADENVASVLSRSARCSTFRGDRTHATRPNTRVLTLLRRRRRRGKEMSGHSR